MPAKKKTRVTGKSVRARKTESATSREPQIVIHAVTTLPDSTVVQGIKGIVAAVSDLTSVMFKEFQTVKERIENISRQQSPDSLNGESVTVHTH